MKQKRAWAMRFLGLGISCLALAALLYKLDWQLTRAAFARASASSLLVGVGFTALAYSVAVFRWQVLLSTQVQVPFRKLLSLLLVGHFANVVLPLRAGDILRPVLLRRATGGHFALAVTSMVVERLLDVATIVVMGAVVLPTIQAPGALKTGLTIFSWVCLGGTLFVGFVAWQSAQGSALQLWADQSPLINRIGLRRILVPTFQALSLVRNGRALLVAFSLSLVQWGLAAAGVIACVSAFHLGLPFTAGVVLMVATNLGSAIPSAPAAVGVYHAVGVLALAPWSVSTEDALAVTIAAHLTTVVLQVGGGAIAAWHEGGTRVVLQQVHAPPDEAPPSAVP
ncbi:MAG: lysylphosphatidylglycerol synthase transmembrane domain-containing protein [Polyangiaceae bacterium]|nr:lysylphosphatidylglycerol synthase transmembrane domain-containing protein [Polyangiaceae bacterium]